MLETKSVAACLHLQSQGLTVKMNGNWKKSIHKKIKGDISFPFLISRMFFIVTGAVEDQQQRPAAKSTSIKESIRQYFTSSLSSNWHAYYNGLKKIIDSTACSFKKVAHDFCEIMKYHIKIYGWFSGSGQTCQTRRLNVGNSSCRQERWHWNCQARGTLSRYRNGNLKNHSQILMANGKQGLHEKAGKKEEEEDDEEEWAPFSLLCPHAES